ncbi:hypothetical protein Pden_3360 [Paracoccus denitrificans PD1222]|uniref:Uncharacterized protein n=1 Tax=Paracoccus denitrificans (strain Pd 1222) TaxID=318586 RepID=A1B7D9_PARDP|nr:hypothetical protein Pden_3360 [Paracoccus denitrificans PD1222]
MHGTKWTDADGQDRCGCGVDDDTGFPSRARLAGTGDERRFVGDDIPRAEARGRTLPAAGFSMGAAGCGRPHRPNRARG